MTMDARAGSLGAPDADEPEAGALRLIAGLNPFWMAPMRLDKGLQLFERALAALR